MVEVLREHGRAPVAGPDTEPGQGLDIGLGRVCGGAVAAVWLGTSLELCSTTLAPHELDDAALGRGRGLELVAQIMALTPGPPTALSEISQGGI